MRKLMILAGFGLAVMAGLMALSGVCYAQKFPDRPVTVVVNFGAGGSADVAVRLLGPIVEKKLGVPLIVENRVGGGGTTAIAYLAKQKNDGYTIGTTSMSAMVVYPMMQKTPYDPFKDFEYICGF